MKARSAFLLAIAVLSCGFGTHLAGQAIPSDVEVVRDVEYCTGGARTLKLHIIRPRLTTPNLMPALIWIHGGGWLSGSRESGISSRVIRFAQRGYFCVSIEYRLSIEAIFPAQIEDSKCAVRFLRAKAAEYHIDPNHIGAWGPSAGGHLAALLGTSGGIQELEGNGGWENYSSRVQAVCDWYAPTDLLRLGGLHDLAVSAESFLIGGPIPENKEKAARASPITYVSADDAPFLIMHGDRDVVVPFSQSESMNKALAQVSVPSSLHRLRGAGHGGSQFDTEESLALVESFFTANLKTTRIRRRP